MKTTLLAHAAALSIAAVAAAHAQEGGGDPFLFRAPGLTVVAPQAFAADTGSNAYPDVAGRLSQAVPADAANLVPDAGSEAVVQTANSLPRGFEAGTVANVQARSVQRYLAAQIARRARAVQEAGQAPGAWPHG